MIGKVTLKAKRWKGIEIDNKYVFIYTHSSNTMRGDERGNKVCVSRRLAQGNVAGACHSGEHLLSSYGVVVLKDPSSSAAARSWHRALFRQHCCFSFPWARRSWNVGGDFLCKRSGCVEWISFVAADYSCDSHTSVCLVFYAAESWTSGTELSPSYTKILWVSLFVSKAEGRT